MLFEILNAHNTFQRASDIIITEHTWKTCLVYHEDILILSQTKISIEKILKAYSQRFTLQI